MNIESAQNPLWNRGLNCTVNSMVEEVPGVS